jgi:hypothetical protein
MVRGEIPFALVPAIKAALKLAEYVTNLFDAKNALPMSPTPDLDLEKALAMVIQQTSEISPKGINTSLLQYVLVQVMQWLASKASE